MDFPTNIESLQITSSGLGRDVRVVAIFLHDVQRTRKAGNIFGINSTFKSNHFIGYPLALNRLDGVYYVDPRPAMAKERHPAKEIGLFSKFLLTIFGRFNVASVGEYQMIIYPGFCGFHSGQFCVFDARESLGHVPDEMAAMSRTFTFTFQPTDVSAESPFSANIIVNSRTENCMISIYKVRHPGDPCVSIRP